MTHANFGRWATVLALGGLAALSCRRPDYFPLKNGQVWQYEANVVVPPDTATAESFAYAIAVTGSSVEAGLGRVYAVRFTRDEESHMAFVFRKTKEAVLVLPSSLFNRLEPASDWVRLLELPLRAGAFWYGSAEYGVSVEVLSREAVTVPAGTFRNCFRIRVRTDAPYAMDLWLAPNSGIVQWRRRLSRGRVETVQLLAD
jgi:hypothetical protein